MLSKVYEELSRACLYLGSQYAEAIRKEYCHVPHTDFGPGRAKILEGFVSQHSAAAADGPGTAAAAAAALPQPLYFTERGQALFEASARANIAAEMKHLRASGSRTGDAGASS